ncbi:MAG: universal stress protein, partial [Nitrosopumilaceae archaeon]
QPIRYDRKLMQKEGNRLMKSAKIRSAQKGILFRHKISSGNPGKEIVKLADNKRNNFDLVVISSRGLGGAKELFLGSVANYVIHKSKTPVLIVK